MKQICLVVYSVRTQMHLACVWKVSSKNYVPTMYQEDNTLLVRLPQPPAAPPSQVSDQ